MNDYERSATLSGDGPYKDAHKALSMKNYKRSAALSGNGPYKSKTRARNLSLAVPVNYGTIIGENKKLLGDWP